MVQHGLAQPLQGPKYKTFSRVTRCLHFNDFFDCMSKESLLSHPLFSRVNDSVAGLKVLWFAPSKPMTMNNFYGNVSFTIQWDKVLARFPHFYYVDQSVYNTHVGTRIILSKNKLNNFSSMSCDSVDCPPLVRDDKVSVDGVAVTTWKHATECLTSRETYPHELEIAVLVTPEDCSWLFRKCQLGINDHSHANICGPFGGFEHHICHRYNLKGRWCPYPYDVESASLIVDGWFQNISVRNKLYKNGRPAIKQERVKATTTTRTRKNTSTSKTAHNSVSTGTSTSSNTSTAAILSSYLSDLTL